MKNILVTGGAGYIGSHTAKLLKSSGFEPIVFDNLSTGHKHFAKWGSLVEGDLSDLSALDSLFKNHKIDAVIHFAANAYVGESFVDPKKYFGNNVRNTLNLLDKMLEFGVKHLVFSSTCATYGTPEKLPISESTPQNPINPYGESKLFIEKVLSWYAQAYQMNSVRLRYFNAAGADPDGEIGEIHDPETHLIPIVLEVATGKRKHLEVFGTDYPTSDGTAVRDYIHVTDLASAHIKALQHLEKNNGSFMFNLGTGHGYSVKEVVDTIEKTLGLTVKTKLSPRRPGDPPSLVANATKARAELGWNPQFSDLPTIIKTAFHWMKKNEI